jgi:putative hydrolase of the HAD superfamily
MTNPKVIFLDAVGTLFGVKGSVGRVYSDIAKSFGVEVDTAALNQAFLDQFKAAPPMAFPNTPQEDVAHQEYLWWENIACLTFAAIGKLDDFQDFQGYFAKLYDHFKTADPWEVYEDVIPALHYWHGQGIQLGVVSNFDSRLHSVLHALKLDQFFTSVTVSTEVGAAKPNPHLFEVALAKHDCKPDEAWHIGDSVEQDYQPAAALGMRGILIQRAEG